MKKLLLLIAVLSSSAFAATTYQPTQSQTAVVPYSADHRVIFFQASRNWFTQEGEILVCPFNAVSDNFNTTLTSCKLPGGKAGWMLITNMKIDGFELTGISYTPVYSGAYERSLTVYFERSTKIKSTQNQVVNGTITVNNLTINAEQVTVQRKKK
mgnify:CR=1 FL=1